MVAGGPGEGDERATSTTANSTRKLSRFACPHVANYMTVSPYPASTTFIFSAPFKLQDDDEHATIIGFVRIMN